MSQEVEMRAAAGIFSTLLWFFVAWDRVAKLKGIGGIGYGHY